MNPAAGADRLRQFEAPPLRPPRLTHAFGVNGVQMHPLTAVMLVIAMHGLPPMKAHRCEQGSQEPGVPAEYQRLSCLGHLALQSGRFREAAAFLEQALKVPLFEIPNYELYADLAAARCGMGQYFVGQQLIVDFECMLQVDSGELACYAGSEAERKGLGHELRRNEGLTDRCFRTMCAELYLPYYEEPTKETLAAIARQREDLVKLKVSCVQPRP